MRPTKIELRGYMSDKKDEELIIRHPSGEISKITLKNYDEEASEGFKGGSSPAYLFDEGGEYIDDLEEFAKNLIERQEPLDPEFEKIFNDNYWELIESDWNNTLLDGLDEEWS
jgi:hypothetical protein